MKAIWYNAFSPRVISNDMELPSYVKKLKLQKMYENLAIDINKGFGDIEWRNRKYSMRERETNEWLAPTRIE